MRAAIVLLLTLTAGCTFPYGIRDSVHEGMIKSNQRRIEALEKALHSGTSTNTGVASKND